MIDQVLWLFWPWHYYHHYGKWYECNTKAQILVLISIIIKCLPLDNGVRMYVKWLAKLYICQI